MLPMFMAVTDQTIVATALPAIARQMGEVERTSWVVVSYLIAATVSAPIYGRLGDAFGRKKLMYFTLPIFVLSSILCALAPSLLWLTAARLLQGVGGGGLMTLSHALIGEAIPPRERGRYQGYFAAVGVGGNAFGPVVGGYLTQHFGWQTIFLVNVPLGLLAALLVYRLPLYKGPRSQWRADPGGLVLFALFVGASMLALDQLRHARIEALPLGLTLLAVGIAAAGFLLRHESRTPSPLIPVKLLRDPAIWRSDGLAACHGATLVSMITFLPVYLEVVRGATPSETGLLLLPVTAGIGIGSLVTGRLVTSTGRTMVYPMMGLTAVSAGLIVFALWSATMDLMLMSILLAWIGFFMGSVMGVVQITVLNVAGATRLGAAAASVQFSRSIGAAFGTALVGTVLFAYLVFKNPDAALVFAQMVEHKLGAASDLPVAQRAMLQADIVAAFRAAFLMIAGFSTLGIFLAHTNPQRTI